ncbi:MAG: hypothetical protein HXY34_05380 [Candidatus Thorarchaeota archaeon]|nr:hypothetical protein [Candidatus Thorarchaeota archaeon]
MSLPPYWTSPLESRFEVTISGSERADRQYQVQILEAVVRPEGGGQAGDRGVLVIGTRNIPFVNTVDSDGKVCLVTEEDVPAGTRWLLEIDMGWRRAMMRNHSSEHLFVASLKRIRPQVRLGYIWIDGEHGTVDVSAPGLTVEDVIKAEGMVQNLILEDIQTSTAVVAPGEVRSDVRAREGVTQKHDRIRVVSFGDFDSSACSGTHVLHTGDIGHFKVVDVSEDGGSLRVEFVTGARAIAETSRLFNTVLIRRHTHPIEYAQLGPVLDKAKTLSEQYALLLDKCQEMLVRSLHFEPVGGVMFAHECLPGFEPGRLRHLVDRIPIEGPYLLLLFIPGVKSSIIAIGNELPVPAAEIMKEIVVTSGGKGGGGEVFTGGFVNVTDPTALYDRIIRLARDRLVELARVS